MSRWYIIHAYSGFENKVRDAIMAEATRLGLDRRWSRRSRSRPRRSPRSAAARRSRSDRKFFPGYVLAKLPMTDDVYHLVKNTPKVTGFLGSIGQAAADLATPRPRASSTPRTKPPRPSPRRGSASTMRSATM